MTLFGADVLIDTYIVYGEARRFHPVSLHTQKDTTTKFKLQIKIELALILFWVCYISRYEWAVYWHQ